MIGSLAMCLRYSFGLGEAADLVEGAITKALASGARTRDIAGEGKRPSARRRWATRSCGNWRSRAGSERSLSPPHSDRACPI